MVIDRASETTHRPQRGGLDWRTPGCTQRPPTHRPGTAGDRCHTAGLSLAVVGSDGAAGTIFDTFRFTNTLAVPCTMFGFVGAQGLDALNNPVPTRVVRGGGMLTSLPGAQTVDVAPGGSADFTLSWSDVPVGNETTCPPATQLAVIPPDELAPLIVAVTLAPCNAGTIRVSAVRPSSRRGALGVS
jgi:hypothetical protein